MLRRLWTRMCAIGGFGMRRPSYPPAWPPSDAEVRMRQAFTYSELARSHANTTMRTSKRKTPFVDLMFPRPTDAQQSEHTQQ